MLYVSGYSEEAIESHASGLETLNFIRKPFTPDFLARRVRQVLDHKESPHGARTHGALG